MKHPLRQLFFTSLISLPLSAAFAYYGYRDKRWFYLALGGIILFSWFISALQLRRLYQNNKILAEALVCPQCNTLDGLDFELLSQTHRDNLMEASIQEYCTHCDYKTDPVPLNYPLEIELAEVIDSEAQAKNIANRRAEETWYRNKVLKMVSEE